MSDWNPESYGRFADVRLQPALDLLARIVDLPGGEVVDLGCGAGVMGAAFAARFAPRRVIGVDNSPAMLERAGATGGYAALDEADIATWEPRQRPALIFSNAALQWLGDHAGLMPRLAAMLPEGGVLAVQMPYQHGVTSHMGWSGAERRVFGETRTRTRLNVLTPDGYFDLLSPLGDLQIWQVEYLQHLAPSGTGHPVRLFTESTFGRPFLDGLDAEQRARLIAAYEEDMASAYPLRADGSVLFPFRRLFFTLRR